MTYLALAVVLLVASIIIYVNFKEEKPVEEVPVVEKEVFYAPETTVSIVPEPQSTPEPVVKSEVIDPVVKKKAPAKKTVVKKKTNE